MRNDRSFIELRARERARTLLDDGSYRELLDPFDGIMSPWLGAQGIVPQSDDGMVVAKGTINGQPAVVIAIEGTFQGGRYSRRDCRPAPLHPGNRHCRRYRRLLRRDVHRRGAVQLPDCHP